MQLDPGVAHVWITTEHSPSQFITGLGMTVVFVTSIEVIFQSPFRACARKFGNNLLDREIGFPASVLVTMIGEP